MAARQSSPRSHRGSSTSKEVATPAEFVQRFGAKRVIEKVLIANNGIAAVKCIRSIRKWAYETFGNEKAIRFVAMVTPEDLNANAEYIRMADQLAHVPGGANNYNYSNVDVIVNVAKRELVHAVWAGWGHASEYPKLPETLQKNGIIFIGPPEGPMRTLGDKIASTIVAQSANVPTMPWSGSGIRVENAERLLKAGRPLVVSEDRCRKCFVESAAAGIKIANQIGFPVMIKASAGGGGKGIRKAVKSEDFATAFRQVQAEVPGSPIFIMKLAENSRHLEVQILADEYGNAISLFGRDCSIQRRHQKIIEEAPVTAAGNETLKQMEKAAVRLTKMAGYVNAGTVEYLYTADGEYYFLELNPRLQVEHPCTEILTNVNLPAAQLQIAMGLPLHCIKDIRLLYGKKPWESSPIDFENPDPEPRPTGHVIAARITAENPDEGFKPSGGTIQDLTFRSSKNVWAYFSVGTSGGLHEFADSQFGHCFAWGEDREAARTNLVDALSQVSVRGDFRTTVEYLIKLLKMKDFVGNAINTTWLDHLIAEKMQAERPDEMVAVVSAALHIADSTFHKRFSEYEHSLARGQIINAEYLISAVLVDLIYGDVKYSLQVSQSAANSYFLLLNDSWIELPIHRMSDGAIVFSLNENSYNTYMREEVVSYRVIIDDKTCVFDKENDPSLLRSPCPGKLMQYLVDDGGHIFAHDSYCEIEVMKNVMTLSVDDSGCVHYVKYPGAILDAGTVIARLDLDDPTKIKKAKPYEGKFPFGQTSFNSSKATVSQTFRVARKVLEDVLNGYCIPEPYATAKVTEAIEKLMTCVQDPTLPLQEMQDILSTISGRVPEKVERQINALLSQYSDNVTSILSQFPSKKITSVIDGYSAGLNRRSERDAFFMNVEQIIQLLQRYRQGVRGHAKSVVLSLWKQYLDVETIFNTGNYEKAVSAMRETNRENLSLVVSSVVSHQQVAKKNFLVARLIDKFSEQKSNLTDDVLKIFQQFTNLNNQKNAKVALKARQIMIESSQPSIEVRHNEVETLFLSALSNPDGAADVLGKLIQSETTLFDVLPSFFYHSRNEIRTAALEVYVRRAYTAYEIMSLNHIQSDGEGQSVVEWRFLLPQSHPNRLRMTRRKYSASSSIPKVASLSEALDSYGSENETPCERIGVMVACDSLEEFGKHFNVIIQRFSESPLRSPLSSRSSSSTSIVSENVDDDSEPKHILSVALSAEYMETEIPKPILSFIADFSPMMKSVGIRRITFLLFKKGHALKYFTFRASTNYTEDTIYRHLEPALAFQLEMNRLSKFDIQAVPTSNHTMHLYLGSAKVKLGQKATDHRLFLRSIIRHSDFVTKEATIEYMVSEGERKILEALDVLELCFNNPDFSRTDCNHIFLNYVPPFIIDDLDNAQNFILPIVLRHGKRLWNLRVMQAEIKLSIRLQPNGSLIPVRLFVTNESGFNLEMQIYTEVRDPKTGVMTLNSYGRRPGPLHGLNPSAPYLPKDYLQSKRSTAHDNNTTYVYDFLDLFKQALIKTWRSYQQQTNRKEAAPKEIFRAVELVLDQQKQLTEISRLPGHNDIGMVAWKVDMITPECPEGRQIIIIANDITHKIGSFGPQEDYLFQRASELARTLGIPRVYIACNSGARIGLAEEVKQVFRVAWNDPQHPDRGIKYLYLTPKAFGKMRHSVNAELIEEDGESRYKIIDIIGEEDGLGVENLQGSGMIAGETSRACDEIVTLSLVSCRTIGIGAYLVRLGQRVIQVESSNIILTGAGALNKVLGREVYTSNFQLGGVQIMHNNGVSHLISTDDLQAVRATVEWLSYIPPAKGAPLPCLLTGDPVDREINFAPSKASYDPRWMLEGRQDPNDSSVWLSGFFDRGTFVETLRPWAQSVLCGRARLGGIPVGVIAVETRSVECVVPADPANLDSESQVLTQAGQVWYPDSAFKTAQAINDFNGEELPLMIFANWRGFSGGMRDMYQEVLKFGALIVDALRKYKQPVLVYIPPYGELRGGAWVVLDPSINPDSMEMYADKQSRGGVLEPEGTVEIKFKMRDVIKAMDRLDPECIRIRATKVFLDEGRRELAKQLDARHKELESAYHEVAFLFADLHDKPGRMQEKGVIMDVLDWPKSREYLYWRLKRKLMEQDALQNIMKADSTLSRSQVTSMLRRWFIEEHGAIKAYLWDDNKIAVDWLRQQMTKKEGGQSVISQNIKFVRRDFVLQKIRSLVQDNPEVAMDSIIYIAQHMTPNQRAELSRVLATMDTTSSS
ncbi:acetyl-CoA carboxylase-like isoform X2 [Oscarella lobularis]|uniref:acetyl-CoA carboxylase-like isoform X2 n=1 Tax=Oscarella lobularis TaxID=121494 RepID=UPI0033136C04